MSQQRSLSFKLVFLWLGILLLTGFWLTAGRTEQVSLVVVPEVPRNDEPIIATFKLSNPSQQSMAVKYSLYANAALLKEGTTTLAPASSKVYQYAYNNSVKLGEQLNFLIRTQSELGNAERAVATPPYPPQIWSSFVSFASFSTSVMSFMSTMTYYQSSFGRGSGVNVGLICTIVLMALLIFLELSRSVTEGKMVAVIGRLRIRFSTMSGILFIIFMGIVYTQIVMILAV